MTRPLIVLIGALSLLPARTFAAGTNITVRPLSWAQPIVMPGITNCFRINQYLYRGAQPTSEGMKALQTVGIRSVINLRAYHSDKDKLAGTGLKGFRFETKPWHAEIDDVIGFLKIATDTNNLPAFVHCQRGADRTGTMCAMYRITVCGWTKEEALKELEDGGFHFAPVWKNLVDFIQNADVQKIKVLAGLTNAPAAEAQDAQLLISGKK